MTNLNTSWHAALKFMACKTPAPKKSKWKKLAGPKSNLMDIVTRSRMSQKPVKGGGTRSKEEDFRARRRKFYRLATEEKPMFPLQQRNFHNFVMENKEVMKMLSLLTTCAQDMKQVTIIISSYIPHAVR